MFPGFGLSVFRDSENNCIYFHRNVLKHTMFSEESFYSQMILRPAKKVDQLVNLTNSLHRQWQPLHHALKGLDPLNGRRFAGRVKKLFGNVASFVFVGVRGRRHATGDGVVNETAVAIVRAQVK